MRGFKSTTVVILTMPEPLTTEAVQQAFKAIEPLPTADRALLQHTLMQALHNCADLTAPSVSSDEEPKLRPHTSRTNAPTPLGPSLPIASGRLVAQSIAIRKVQHAKPRQPATRSNPS